MQNKKTNRINLANQLSFAMLGAMAFILMQFSFPIIPAFPYLKMDLSDTIVVIAAFIYGPIGAIVIALIKSLLDFLLKGANFMTLIGDIAAFAASISFALPIYYFLKNKMTGVRKVIAFILGTISLTIVLAILNYFFITPIYISLAGFKISGSLLNYVLATIIPFNLLKGTILSIITYLLMKTLLPTIKHYLSRH